MRLSMDWNRDCGKMQRFLNFLGVALYGKRQQRGRLAGKDTTCFPLRLAELLPACSGCDAWLIRLAKPAAR